MTRPHEEMWEALDHWSHITETGEWQHVLRMGPADAYFERAPKETDEEAAQRLKLAACAPEMARMLLAVEWQGYIEGAMRSGVRAAAEVAARHNA